MAMTKDDLKVGCIYSAKHPRDCWGNFNDRQIAWISSCGDSVQYDSPTVRTGRHLPTVSMDKFLRWADKDVTDITPDKAWRKFQRKTKGG